MASNDTLLEEIRTEHERFKRYWRPIFDEGDTDMRFIAGDPWDPEERQKRYKKRLCLGMDQLGQYVNQLVNEVKANPRAIKVLPSGDGADDKMAERRAELIRGIEYRSNAQLAYTWGFQNAVQRSYGSWRVTTKYVSDSNFDQELVIQRILNPNTVLLDPYAQERDFSDMERAFVITTMSKERFQKEFPNADVKSFSSEVAPGWLSDESVQVAEYWRVEKKSKTLYLLPDGQVTEFLPPGIKPVKKRDSTTNKIKQHLTNGVEILDTINWPGEYIPIIPCFGRELWIADGGSTKRVFMSLIRLGRDGQMLYSFMRTNEAEEAKMAPKAPFVGIEGQFEGHETEWTDVFDQPKAYLEVKGKTDATGDQILGPPTRPQFQPNFQAYSFAAEDSRRDIQAAMGITSLPTATQRQNEKSGIALQRIEAQMSKGSYDFLDSYEIALQHTGRILNALIPTYYDKPRDVGIQKTDGAYGTLRINDQGYTNPNTKRTEFFDMTKGKYNVTISTGPSFDSQREEATQFVDLLVANIKNLPIPPPLVTKLLALAVRLKTLGPIGDKMADLLDPKPEDGQQELPPQVMQALQKLQKENQALDAFGKQAQEQIVQMQQEKDSKAMELASKEKIAVLDARLELVKLKAQIEGEAMLATLKAELENLNVRLGEYEKTSGGEGEGAPAEQNLELNV